MATAPKKKKEKKVITNGIVHIYATFNNTIVTITDVQGNVISQSSAGAQGFKGSRKSTPYAGQMAAEAAGQKAQDQGMKTLDVQMKGPGPGRESALRSLQALGLIVNSIVDITPIPHNGCRARKKRRV